MRGFEKLMPVLKEANHLTKVPFAVNELQTFYGNKTLGTSLVSALRSKKIVDLAPRFVKMSYRHGRKFSSGLLFLAWTKLLNHPSINEENALPIARVLTDHAWNQWKRTEKNQYGSKKGTSYKYGDPIHLAEFTHAVAEANENKLPPRFTVTLHAIGNQFLAHEYAGGNADHLHQIALAWINSGKSLRLVPKLLATESELLLQKQKAGEDLAPVVKRTVRRIQTKTTKEN